MKKIFVLLTVLLLLMSGCGKKETPEDVLRNAYAKMEDLDSYTMDGTVTVEMSGVTLPMNYRTTVLRHDKSDETDDELYMDINMDVIFEQMTMKIWIKDGVTYTYDGNTMTETETDYSAASPLLSDPNALSKLIFDNIESSEMTKDGDDTVITLTMKKEFMSTFLNTLSGEGNSLDLNIVSADLGDLVLTVNKEGYVYHTYLTMEAEVEGNSAAVTTDLYLKDINSAVIPEIDPSYYESDSTSTDDSGLDYIDIVFDDGIEVFVLTGEDRGYTIFFDEEETMIEIYDPEGNYCSDGFFLTKEFADEAIEEIRNSDDEAYQQIETDLGYSGESASVRGYSEGETEYFNPDTPFLFVSFADHDLGVVLVGYDSYEAFKTLTDGISFMVSSTPE